jgi:hypothetical protein
MIKSLNNKSLAIGIPGLIIDVAGQYMMTLSGMGLIGGLVFLIGVAMFITGLAYYAKSKGYHWALGFLGLLSCIGLIVLAVLPDKAK